MTRQRKNPVRYQIKVLLRDIEPPIWRTILVRSDLTLRTLHHVLRIAMGWTSFHGHQFTFKKKCYGYPDPDGEAAFGFTTIDDTNIRLEQIVTGKGQRLNYEYDLGDSWEHFLTVQKVLPLDEEKTLALCVAGARACPPEDVGGTPGYEQFLNAVRYPNHREHKAMLRWVGGAFDSEAFDLNEVNRKLQRAVRPPRQRAAA